jgi:RNA polymerase sigma-70 factor (ECF subfamily)
VGEPTRDMADWLADARTGSPEALGRALEACRGYLLHVARQELDPALQPKGGPSDIVQETMLDAYRDFARFEGGSEAELLAWLHRMLLNNLISFTRRYREADKRQVGREVAWSSDSSSGTGAGVPADAPSPSRQMMAVEQAQAVQQAIARLPEDYQRVIRLRYEEEQSFEDIGRAMSLTANAARKLWLRAVKRLQAETVGPP